MLVMRATASGPADAEEVDGMDDDRRRPRGGVDAGEGR